ncbi:phospholipase C/P1 nuclease [Lojkania enalia]|uniref:Phospholipase C/P1 nuclease n=1 Tax=Lojkania enalia TaxID=147567 RepID=A0A9P4N9J7_9PLEO|nr:phospholipase C/P1 nuclease [Didymosphaeria enalia]
MHAFKTLTLLCATPVVHGWGELGHRTVAYLAEKYLTSAASDMVSSLLANDRGYDISDAALWADTVKRRPGYTHTREWHYIDAADDPPTKCGVNYKRDCRKGPGCIVSAIANMTGRVNEDPVQVQQKEALMYLIHFIGDIHQPLHTENMSRGGNDIHVCFDKRCAQTQNLHSVWDKEIPHKMRGLKAKEGEDKIMKEAAAEWADELFAANGMHGDWVVKECSNVRTAEKCALVWATEANQWICDVVLRNGVEWIEENDLGGEYYEEAAPVVTDLMAKAGLRLGAWINELAKQREDVTFVIQETERIEV